MVFYGITRLTDGSFLAFVVYEAAALTSLGVYLRLADRASARRRGPMAAAMAVSLAAGVVQASGVGPFRIVWDSITTGIPSRAIRRRCVAGDRSSPAPRFGRLRNHSRRLHRERAAMFDRDLRALRRELEAYPEERQIWQPIPGLPNTAGTLAPSGGNLQHYVGARGAGRYVRDRDTEFARRDVPRAELIAGIERARAAVAAGLDAVAADELNAEYPELIGGCRIRTGISWSTPPCTSLPPRPGRRSPPGGYGERGGSRSGEAGGAWEREEGLKCNEGPLSIRHHGQGSERAGEVPRCASG